MKGKGNDEENHGLLQANLNDVIDGEAESKPIAPWWD